MQDYNGMGFEIAKMLGKLDGHMDHQARALEQSAEMQAYHTEILLELPAKIAMAISSRPTSANPHRSTLGSVARIAVAAKEVMPPLREIIAALVILAATLGWIVPSPTAPGQTPRTQSPGP